MADVIVRDPEILGGRPVFQGTRVPVNVLFENLEDGLSIDEIIESYPSLNRADSIACLEGACANAVFRGCQRNAIGQSQAMQAWKRHSLGPRVPGPVIAGRL